MACVLPSIILAASAAGASPPAAGAEKTYWDCEFTAMHGTIDLDEAAACNAVYEQLKKEKFRGDFGRFLVWWRENKDRELSSRMKQQQPQRAR